VLSWAAYTVASSFAVETMIATHYKVVAKHLGGFDGRKLVRGRSEKGRKIRILCRCDACHYANLPCGELTSTQGSVVLKGSM
jgi:hypothetical protein